MTRKLASPGQVLLAFAVCFLCGNAQAQTVAGAEERLREVKIALDDKSLLKFMADFAGPKDIDKIKQLIKQLDSPRFNEREEAQRLLRAQGSRAVPFLKEAKKTANVEVARRIQDCLVFLKDRRERFLCAVFVLAARGNRDAMPVLWDALDDNEPGFNRSLTEHYFEKLLKPADLSQVIEKAKTDPRLAVRACAVSLSRRFSDQADLILPAAAERLRKDKSPAVRIQAVNVLQYLVWHDKRQDAIPFLIEAIEDSEPDPITKWTVGGFAADYVGAMGEKKALPALIKAAQAPNENLRRGAFNGLGGLLRKHPEIVSQIFPLFEKALYDPRQPLVDRWGAMIPLRYMGEQGIGHLIRLLKDETPQVRERALSNLKELGPKARKAVPEIVKVVNDPAEKEWFRIDAIKALGEIGGDAALSALKRDFRLYYLNQEAKMAIKKISSNKN